MSTGSTGLLERRVHVGDDEARIYTMRDLNQHTADVMRHVQEHGPAFITKHGRFVAVIKPLGGRVESAALAAMAREIKEEIQAGT